MSKHPQFSLAFNIANSNKERIEAFELYHKAYNAKKLSESYPPDGTDLHIMMEINGFQILLAPGDDTQSINNVVCQLKYINEQELRKAYEVMIKESSDFSIGTYPWTEVGAFVRDKFGVAWWLYI